ncbi:unnamed protein product [Amoebophrya sp. A120]|nr:unnamed protein product [Amoebophrya sp. A120]|eukprot:GSA120T00009220001.1
MPEMFQRVVLPAPVTQYLDTCKLDTALADAMNETTTALSPDPFGDLVLRLSEKLADTPAAPASEFEGGNGKGASSSSSASGSGSSSSSSSSRQKPLGGPQFGKIRVVKTPDATNPRRVLEVIMNVRGAPVRVHSFGLDVRIPPPPAAENGSEGSGVKSASNPGSGTGSNGSSTGGMFTPTVFELECFCGALFQSSRTELLDLGPMFLPEVLESLFPTTSGSSSRPGTGMTRPVSAASRMLSGSDTERPKTGTNRTNSALSSRARRQKYQSFSLRMQGNLCLAYSKINSGETVFELLMSNEVSSVVKPKTLDKRLPEFFCGIVYLKLPEGSEDGGEEEPPVPDEEPALEENPKLPLWAKKAPFVGVSIPWTSALAEGVGDEASGFANGIEGRTSMPTNAWSRMAMITEKVNEALKGLVGEQLVVEDGILVSKSIEDGFAVVRQAAESVLAPPSESFKMPSNTMIEEEDEKFSFTPILSIPDEFTPTTAPLEIPDTVLETNPNLRIFGSPLAYKAFDVERVPGPPPIRREFGSCKHQAEYIPTTTRTTAALQTTLAPINFDSPLAYAQQALREPLKKPIFGFSNELFVTCTESSGVLSTGDDSLNYPFLDIILASDCAVLYLAGSGISSENALEKRFQFLMENVDADLYLPAFVPVMEPMEPFGGDSNVGSGVAGSGVGSGVGSRQNTPAAA